MEYILKSVEKSSFCIKQSGKKYILSIFCLSIS